MPQFNPGEEGVAIATFPTKPAGLECTAELWLASNMTKVATSGEIPFTATGENQAISLPITLPDVEGTYHVYLYVFSNGQCIARFLGDEDVVIKALPAVGDFVYSNQVCGMTTFLPAPSWTQATYSCTITNHGSRGTRVITFHYEYFHRYMGKMMGVYSEDFELTLEPGQSYTFTRRSGDDFNQVFGTYATITMWLEDNASGGTEPCVQETPAG